MRGVFALGMSFALSAVLIVSAPAVQGAIQSLHPPDQGFFSKVLYYRGIPIKAHADVTDEALIAAHLRLRRMLSKMPTVVANLEAEAVELHIIGRNQVTSDLPYLRHFRGKPYDGQATIDERTRGVGGQFASCGEENLLRLPDDRYAGRDICVHEFAHTIFTYGLDPATRRRVEQQYRASLDAGRWKGAYAGTNVQEFFAELSMWYFGTRGDHGSLPTPPQDGAEGLRAYDPQAYQLLDDIYSGRVEVSPLRLTVLQPVASRPDDTRSTAGVPTIVRFRNETRTELRLYWIDYDGQRHPYGSVWPGQQRAQETYEGHLWVLLTPDGKEVATYRATPEPGLAILRGRRL